LQKLNKFRLPEGFRGKNFIVVQLWYFVQSTLFAWSPQILYKYRAFLLSLFGAEIGKNVKIRPSCKITYPWKITIGDYTWIGDDVVLYSLGKIEIGRNVVISQKSYLCTGSHDYKADHFDIYSNNIKIEDKVWIATDVYIAPGVMIGEAAVVGARSSVFKNLPSNSICIGSPAKVIKKRV